ncbi:Microsomal signal peptidase 12kDa subunit [Purpureocillium lavendulum]|uniref:Microsomal signal peptidase 12kDa subunit n=1 Tax=Purpureocillium lavendulum TaxID=1247861 RepID=A0AB34FSB7_9HYPO|nr:Microsomal signal peptidase 12kDa subunit [Purpureocillium lavendulum]
MGNPDGPAEAAAAAPDKIPDMPQRAMYQQTVPVALEVDHSHGGLGSHDMPPPPSYEEAAASGAAGSAAHTAGHGSGSGSGPTTPVPGGSTTAAAEGSEHGRPSQRREEAPASRGSSVDAGADDALLGGSWSRPDERQRPSHHEQQHLQPPPEPQPQPQPQQPKPHDDASASDAAFDVSGYKGTDPMKWELRERNGDWNKLDDEPGCCASSSGGCCFSSRGGCCFSDRGGCCFSDREGCFFSDRGGCFFSDTAGCCFSSGGACCCSDHVERWRTHPR